MWHGCGCDITLLLVMTYDFIELQQFCINYPSSHWEEMNTKGLTMDQILTVKKAATTAPQLSRAVICRNMLLHNSPTKEITPEHARTVQCPASCLRCPQGVDSEFWSQKQLCCLAINESFGALTVYAEQNAWSDMVCKHDNPHYS
jgi:hypothetical protein